MNQLVDGKWVHGSVGAVAGQGSYKRQTVTEAAVKSVVRSVSTQLGRAIARGILGGNKRGF